MNSKKSYDDDDDNNNNNNNNNKNNDNFLIVPLIDFSSHQNGLKGRKEKINK